jgi:hypothetical protein
MENAFFEQINVDDLDLPDVIVLSDGGDWCYLKDFLSDRMADSHLLRRINRPEECHPPKVIPAKKPKTPEVIAEKSPEDALFEKIEQMGRPDAAKIADAYKAGKGIGKISQELKIPAPEIKKILKEQGVPLRINRQFYPNIIQAAKDGMSVDLIARRFDTCPEYVQNVIDGKGGKQ